MQFTAPINDKLLENVKGALNSVAHLEIIVCSEGPPILILKRQPENCVKV